MKYFKEQLEIENTLDPKNWTQMRELGHRMIDDIMDYLQNIREQPVWKKIPDGLKYYYEKDIPLNPQNIQDIYSEFKQFILPYNKGNVHPRHWSWVEGNGTPFGVLADLLASGMNANVTIGEHAAMYIDGQVIEWCKQMLNYPKSATGILVSGGSIANITALIVARNNLERKNIRKDGVRAVASPMVIYSSTETHSCIQKAAEVIGIGTNGVRKIPVNKDYRINIAELKKTIEVDLSDGYYPFCVIGNAGTVNTGAIDDLNAINEICRKYKLWFHVDGAFGALAKLIPEYSNELQAIELADSVAFDLHKWMYMPYEVGCTLIKNGDAHRNAFSIVPNYLLHHERGLASGPEPINNYGMELSRGFKALKVWMSLKEHGLKKYVSLIRQNIAQAFFLESLIKEHEELELITPVTMNIVCYRYLMPGLTLDQVNLLNKEILMNLQERGIASPSYTILNEKYAIRVAITNHRSRKEDFELLIKETIKIGYELINQSENKSSNSIP
jgi:glutamate/tyrosine decarboxylase-like PLP-dependent enzyme